jgi:formylmethanofuran dehydrogenase subunit A
MSSSRGECGLMRRQELDGKFPLGAGYVANATCQVWLADCCIRHRRADNCYMLLRIVHGTVYDPANGVDGKVQDVWVRDGRIVAAPDVASPDQTIDASGLVVMPGGVDMHTHMAGPKVNAARKLRPDDRRNATPVPRTADRRSGTAGSVPSTFATGALYAGLGYTTAIDAAVPPLGARRAHLEFADTPVVDAGMLLSLGDHLYALEQIAAGETERLRDFIAWMMKATHAYGVKLVNPGGVEAYKRGIDRTGLEDLVAPYGLSPRRILAAYAAAVDELKLPHSIHVHCAELGRPGNWSTTLESMKAIEGRRGHFTHIQFHSYGDTDGFSSRAAELADYVNSHANITVDVGQVLFGETTALTGDGAVGHFLHRATGRRWVDVDTECEAGCGIVPLSYREASLVNALQWAIGLEWFLLVRDPWRIALTTDHPNGASFLAYPEIVQLLMSRDARREVLARLPAKVRERTKLAEMDREYTLNEIAIVTRAAPARILGLANKGHLGVGANADVTIYTPNVDRREMFTLPRCVLKAGQIIVENGELRRTVFGGALTVRPPCDADRTPHWRDWFERHYSMQFANFAIGAEELGERLL